MFALSTVVVLVVVMVKDLCWVELVDFVLTTVIVRVAVFPGSRTEHFETRYALLMKYSSTKVGKHSSTWSSRQSQSSNSSPRLRFLLLGAKVVVVVDVVVPYN